MITSNLISLNKLEILELIEHIERYGKEINVELTEEDIKFYKFLGKHILFFKQIQNTYSETIELSVLISDFLFYISSDLKKEERYNYLIERSIIENYLRISLDVITNKTHITYREFESLKSDFTLEKEDFDFIYQSYKKASNFIHGGNLSHKSLSTIFDDCIKPATVNMTRKQKHKRHASRTRLIKLLDNVLIEARSNVINDAFHRSKDVLKYLLGEDAKDKVLQADK